MVLKSGMFDVDRSAANTAIERSNIAVDSCEETAPNAPAPIGLMFAACDELAA